MVSPRMFTGFWVGVRMVCGCCLRTQQCVLFVIVPNFLFGCGPFSHPCRGGVAFFGNSQFWFCFCLLGFAFRIVLRSFYGEFDPGSGRTLAACLTHASRTVRPLRGYTSGERVSNTWVICPALRDKPGKLGLIPDIQLLPHGGCWKVFRCRMCPRPISLLVG